MPAFQWRRRPVAGVLLRGHGEADRRHAGEGRPDVDGEFAGSTLPAAGSPPRRVRRSHTRPMEDAQWPGKSLLYGIDARPASRNRVESAQTRIQRPALAMVPRTAAQFSTRPPDQPRIFQPRAGFA